MPAAKYPAIPEPTTDPASLRDTVLSIKQAFEILTGQRGDPANAALLPADIATKAPLASPTFTGDVTTGGRFVGAGAFNNVQNGGASGAYDIDATGKTSYTLAVGGTVDFFSMSGMIVVNSPTNGACEAWVCGGGGVSKFATSGGVIGALAFNPAVGGYRYTASIAGAFNFVVIRTRNTA